MPETAGKCAALTCTMLNAERHGAGRPLLMVHGLGGSIRSWDPLVSALGKSRLLVIPDLPGHGASPAFEGRQAFAAFVDALQTFIEREGLHGADMVGSSVGGRIVLELSRRGIGGHCVALDPGGFWRGWETRYVHLTLAGSARLVRTLRPLIPTLSRHALSRMMLLAQLSAQPARLDPSLVRAELQSIASTPIFDAMLRELVQGPLQEGTASPPGRMTIGWGRRDRLLLPRQAARAAAAFPSARLHWFENCGHFPQWDRPEEAARVIMETVA
ncbi:alpha/beta fold hydrolase [Paracoccus beibuensis]|uniref:alpha/beta fold hydrolase n=1 Tax=Paracoccus beibuensis TaxID=547602 RepID=UPI00223F8B06|nr:alpha/beta fold hydrolase [Paracoccus beibuensis]